MKAGVWGTIVVCALSAAGLNLVACGGDTGGDGGSGGTGGSTSSSSSSGTASSSSGSTSSSSGSTSSSSGSSGSCDNKGTCQDADMDATNDCLTCALNGPCIAEATQCFQTNPDCSAFNDCLGACPSGDQACVNDCVSAHQGGLNDFLAVIDCGICQNCATDCDAASNPNCGM